ncbi:MAG: 50S ribosomal protein L29 [Candidatus Paceibacterota bacterium]
MTTMQDITNMNDTAIVEFVREKREEVRASRFNSSARDVRAIRTAKKDIARALTELTRRSKALAQ